MPGNDQVDTYIGQKIREKRLKLSLTLNDLAQKLKISLQQIQKYEQGKSRISAMLLYKLSMIFGVAPSYFYEGMSFSQRDLLNIEDNDTISFDRPKNINIFLIEDDSSDEMLIREVLSESPYAIKIFSTHDGEKAMEFLRNKTNCMQKQRPDIILLDLNIPKRNGHYVLKEVKRDSELQDIPIVILTNSVNVKEMIMTYKNHASGYICKSFDLDVFKHNLLTMVEYWANVVVLPRMAS